nr:tetratricopeptide repeat protein [Shewanella sairae]
MDVQQVYYGQGFKICCRQRTVYFAEHIVEVRPKTLALIIHLIESDTEICPKAELLETIWDDVQCDEQVLFQTISEIRRIFSPHKVVQTFPRKGYSWCAPVSKQDPSIEATTVDPEVCTDKLKPRSHKVGFWVSSVSLVLIIAGLLAIFSFNRSASVIDEGTVIILPVNNNVIGRDHAWVPLGAMDQLIGNLNHRGRVMSTEYVLPLITKLPANSAKALADVDYIFKRTGASLVVETELNGHVRDYQLAYRLYAKQGDSAGVVFSTTVDDALLQLAEIINQHIGDKAVNIKTDFQSELKNELVYQAIDLYKQSKFVAAIQMLESTLALEPENHRVRLLLAQWLIQTGETNVGRVQLRHTIDNNTPDLSIAYLGRYYYWLAMSFVADDGADSLKAIVGSIEYSEQENDFLYLGYAYQLKAQLYNDQGQLTLAEESLLKALSYHQMIYCPMGVSTVKLLLAQLYLQQGREQLSSTYLDAAELQIRLHELPLAVAVDK